MPRRLPVNELVSDPYPIYAALRAEGPVAAVEVRPGYQVWMVTRYAEARQALADSRLGNDPGNGRWMANVVGDAVNAAMNKHLLHADPPDHTRLRRLVSKAFSGTRVAALAPWISELADDLLDRIEPGEKVDFLDSFALPLPLQVICQLIGIPAADRHLFRDWSDVIISGAHQRDRYKDMAEALVAYVQRLTAVKRADPQDDLLSDLISVRDDDDQLSDQELTAMVVLLLFAGHETTMNLLGTGLFLLLTHPEQWSALRADRTLVPAAVEEMLRYEAPLRTTFPRYAREDVQIGEVTIPAGGVVMIALQSANHDEIRYVSNDDFDIVRTSAAHLAFGHGIHFCVGAPLARLEGRIAFNALLDRYESISLAVPPEDLRWRFSTLIRGLESLPIIGTEAMSRQRP